VATFKVPLFRRRCSVDLCVDRLVQFDRSQLGVINIDLGLSSDSDVEREGPSMSARKAEDRPNQ
jgi:hypothetical protein